MKKTIAIISAAILFVGCASTPDNLARETARSIGGLRSDQVTITDETIETMRQGRLTSAQSIRRPEPMAAQRPNRDGRVTYFFKPKRPTVLVQKIVASHDDETLTNPKS